jgi:hypothetical protein
VKWTLFCASLRGVITKILAPKLPRYASLRGVATLHFCKTNGERWAFGPLTTNRQGPYEQILKNFENQATINRDMIFQSGVALFDHLGVKGLNT